MERVEVGTDWPLHIQFTPVSGEGGQVAIAEVEVAKGVWLAGWFIFKLPGGKLCVTGPVAEVSEILSKRVPHLSFEGIDLLRGWKHRILSEYESWSRVQGHPAQDADCQPKRV